ncbi:MAG: HIT family protein [Candidatus Bathyarchaeia archaeon]
MKYDENCIFCKIVQKQAPSSTLYEDDTVLAFLDIRPLNMGHTLVIPKAHYVDIFDIPEKELAAVHVVAKQLALAIKSATGADGISIFEQNGKAAGQDIFHLHVHVVPRFLGQPLPRFSELKEANRAALNEMAMKINKQL